MQADAVFPETPFLTDTSVTPWWHLSLRQAQPCRCYTLCREVCYWTQPYGNKVLGSCSEVWQSGMGGQDKAARAGNEKLLKLQLSTHPASTLGTCLCIPPPHSIPSCSVAADRAYSVDGINATTQLILRSGCNRSLLNSSPQGKYSLCEAASNSLVTTAKFQNSPAEKSI